MRRFEFHDDGSNKFWEINVEGTSLTIRFGKVGSNGQTKPKSLATEALALAEQAKLIKEKTSKGYIEVGGGKAEPTATPAKVEPAKAKVEPEKKVEPAKKVEPVADVPIKGSGEIVPSVIATKADAVGSVRWTPEFQAKIEPRRGAPSVVKSESFDAGEKWKLVVEGVARWKTNWMYPLREGTSERTQRAHAAAMDMFTKGEPPTTRDVDRDAAGLALFRGAGNSPMPVFTEYLLAAFGLPYALSALAVCSTMGTSLQLQFRFTDLPVAVPGFGYHESAERPWLLLRRELALADAATHREAHAQAVELRKTATLPVRCALSYAFPDEPTWAAADADEWLKLEKQTADPHAEPYPVWGFALLSSLDDRTRVERIVERNVEPYHLAQRLYTLLDRFGTSIVPLFIDRLEHASGQSFHYAHPLFLVHSRAAAGALCRWASMTPIRTVHDRLLAYVGSDPELAVQALLDVAGSRSKAASKAGSMLGMILRTHRTSCEAALATLDPKQRAELVKLRDRLAPNVSVTTNVPSVLKEAPAFKGKKAPVLPEFFDSTSLPRPLLVGRKEALPTPAINNLGLVLSSETIDVVAAVTEIKQVCDRDSLADFGWGLFEAWMAAEAPSKEKWALTQLGYFGDDDAVKKLVPMIREWPGMNAHPRATLGLNVLSRIGSDVALMSIARIAEKVKFKALQEHARRLIDALAKQKGLTAEELADRLVPDLDLDDDGSKELDFGGRVFRVGFDEALKPFVKDANGKKLSDLPKPSKQDDATKAEEAVATWKRIKAEAKAVASSEVARFERAMITQRAWKPSTFRDFSIDHPLVIHLVRRLVFVVYDNHGHPAGTFRVAEDRTLADADDRALELPADDAVAGISVVHRLNLDDETIGKWSRIFSEYEIIAPFQQLDRPVYRVPAGAEKDSEIRLVEGLKVPPGKVIGLEHRGWRRGPVEDNGIINEMSKDMHNGASAVLDTSGLYVGQIGESGEQTLGKVSVTVSRREKGALGSLDPIVYSELMTDLHTLKPL